MKHIKYIIQIYLTRGARPWNYKKISFYPFYQNLEKFATSMEGSERASDKQTSYRKGSENASEENLSKIHCPQKF